MRPRHIALVALVLGLAVAGFFISRLLADRDAQRDSEQRAEVAAAQIRGRVEEGVSLTESLHRFMLDTSGTGVTSDQFARNALRWLSPAGFPAAAWVERIPDSGRAAYERRIGQRIVTPDDRHTVVPALSRSYLPATLVSGFAPLVVPGVDLSGVPGMATALARATRRNAVAATALAPARSGTAGVFLVAPAPNLVGNVLRSGYVVVFVSEASLREAASETPGVYIAAGGSTGAPEGVDTVRQSFTAAGQRFDVVVPEEPRRGAAAALPWIILAAGVVLAGLAAALGVNATHRAKAQEELNRIFDLSPDLIAVADFHGRFTRVNPAAQKVLGYPEEELLARPYVDFVHPDDRERTLAESDEIREGKTILSFENRYVRKDGSQRVLEWTSTPVIEDGAMYAMARDVTERRRAEQEVERLADEQAALRRVATLVAEDSPSPELFGAVAREVGTLLGARFAGMIRYQDEGSVSVVATWAAAGEHPPVPDRWPIEPGDPAAMIWETRRPARVEDWAAVPGPIAAVVREDLGVSSSVGCPIVVEGRLWGALAVHYKDPSPLPPDTEARIAQFADLVGTAIANAEARAEVARLAQEQASLRRVATVVARGSPQVEVFTAIAEECAQLFGTANIAMIRYEDGCRQLVAASSGAFKEIFPIGSRQPLGGMNVASRVFETGMPVRIADYDEANGAIGEAARSIGIRSAVGTPIVVEGRPWGALVSGSSQDEPMPPETETRLSQFTELMATAIANTESHARADRLTEEQAALRRMATLVAKEAPPAEVLAKVAEEVSMLLGDIDCSLFRDEGDGTATAVAVSGANVSKTISVGTRLPADGDGVVARVLRDGKQHRIEDYSETTDAFSRRAVEFGIRSAVGCPIVVRGRTWGVAGVGAYEDQQLPPETERRIAQFAELVATAIANADARAEVERLADEQAALRRVATLVAQGASPTSVFDGVAAEMEALLDADQVALSRYEAVDEVTVVAYRGMGGDGPVRAGMRFSLAGDSVTAIVRRTERPARMEYTDEASGAIAEVVRTLAVRVAVGAPVIVEGRLWGVMQASWTGEGPPANTEDRMAKFAELLDTAIANADSRDQLTASRARLLTAADEARRRVVRDLHDGAQQRLVHTIVSLKLAQRALNEDGGEAGELVGQALEQAQEGNTELRELAHGILPAVLTRGGLRAGVEAFVSRLDMAVRVDVAADRIPPEIEASAYFIVAEALTNVVKHARADRADVTARVEEGLLRLQIRDDGIGGADREGHGLVGMADRVTALGGRLEIESPADHGTSVVVTLPLSHD